MSDENHLCWSCDSKEKHNTIAATDCYVEKLGEIFDTEWYLEIKKFDQLDNPLKIDPNYCPLYRHPTWGFFIKRNNNSFETSIIALLNTPNFDMHIGTLNLNVNENSVFIGALYLKSLCELDINLYLPFEKPGHNIQVDGTGFPKLNNLSKDFQTMLDKGNRSDVTLRCGTEVIRAHKIVLEARSEVLEAMFNSEMKETANGEVVIEDMDPSVLRALVSFMYSGHVEDLNLKFTRNLLYASKKYHVKALTDGCIEYLQSILSNDNAFEILEIADLYDESLKSNTIQYICENFNDMKNKKEWQIVKKEKQSLAIEIYSYLEPFMYEIK